MADAVNTKVLYDGPNYAIVHLTNISDGTGESAATKVDPSTLAGEPSELVLDAIAYSASGMAVKLLNDASTATLLWVVPANASGKVWFRDGPNSAPPASGGSPGLLNSSGAGKTGKILFTTVGAGATASYAITLWLRKRTP